MARLLIIHHTPSPHCQEMLEAVVAVDEGAPCMDDQCECCA